MFGKRIYWVLPLPKLCSLTTRASGCVGRGCGQVDLHHLFTLAPPPARPQLTRVRRINVPTEFRFGALSTSLVPKCCPNSSSLESASQMSVRSGDPSKLPLTLTSRLPLSPDQPPATLALGLLHQANSFSRSLGLFSEP